MNDEDVVLGLISLMDINNINRTGIIHIMIGGTDSRGRKIGTFAVTEMIKHAFYNLNLRRIELDVLENNLPAIRLYEKIGFVKEGVKRESNYKNGKYINMILMALLRDDYEQNNAVYEEKV